MYPRLTFSRMQVDMPTVPLGITSQATFWVINQGYTNLELKHRVSPTVPIELDVQYPDGGDVGIALDRVRVVVSGASDQPTSWVGKIEFVDTDNERFSITVTGCSDNSLMTNFPFIRQFNGKFGYLALDDQPIKLLHTAEIVKRVAQDNARREAEESTSLVSRSPERLTKKTGAGGSTKGGALKKADKTAAAVPEEEKPPEPMGQGAPEFAPEYGHREHDWKAAASGYLEVEATVVMKWLNKFVVSRPFDCERFPQCIIETHGDIVVDFIEQISGRKINGIKPGAGEDPMPKAVGGKGKDGPSAELRRPSKGQLLGARIAASQRLVEKFRVVLNFLIQGGALLNHVNAVDLLGQDHHLLAQEVDIKKAEGTRLTPAMLEECKSAWAASWLTNCKYAWMEVLLQVCPTFSLSLPTVFLTNEVLLQALKIYTISRATYKDFLKLPGVAYTGLPTDAQPAAAAAAVATGRKPTSTPAAATRPGAPKKGKEGGPQSTPKEFTQSNVYSPQEVTLMSWAAHHILRAMQLKMQSKMDKDAGDKKRKGDDGEDEDDGDGDVEEQDRLSKLKVRLVDLETTFADMGAYCQLLHSHKPELTRPGGPLVGYTTHDESKTHTNYKKMRAAMDLMFLSFDVQAEELAVTGRTLLLLVAHMYLTLPGLLPKAAVEFQGVIGIPLVKTIELLNPSRKKVGYSVVIEGSPEFSLASKEIVLEPDSQLDFPVTLLAVFASPAATAKLTFLGVRNAAAGVSAGATMVFQLSSVIVGRKPTERLVRNVSVYDLDPVPVTLVNPFDDECNFTMSLVCQLKPVELEVVVDRMVKGLPTRPPSAMALGYSPIPQAPKAAPPTKAVSRPGTRAQAPPEKTPEELEIEAISKQPYWTNAADDVISLAPKASKNILVNFLPFLVGTHSCQIVMTDPTRGEFSYEIISEVGLPKSEAALDFAAVIEDGAPIKKFIKVGAKNPIFERAVTQATDMRVQSSALAKKQARDALMGLLATPVTDEENGVSKYLAVIQSPFFSCLRDLPLASEYGYLPNALPPMPPAGAAATGGKEPKAPQVEKKKRNPKSSIVTPTPAEATVYGNGPSAITLTFNASKAGAYQGRVLIYSKDSNYDVRVLDLLAKTTIPNGLLLITFKGAARQVLTQEIPIHNESEREWSLTATITGPQFSGDKTLKIPPGEVANYILTFRGLEVDKYEGTLLLKNASTEEGDDSFEYTLKGETEEPLAEEHCMFRCAARSKETFSVPLLYLDRSRSMAKKGGKMQRFSVQTDIPNVIGPAEVEVRGGGQRYEFQFFSAKGGTFSGSIIFTDMDTGALVWYTMEILVEAPEAESTINVQAEVRRAVAVEITLDNPTAEELTFNVEIDGPGLIGESTFRLPPSVGSADYEAMGAQAAKRNVYELIFSPLVAGMSSGRISFTNARMGEIWHTLHLEALPTLPTVLEPIECMVGTTGTLAVAIENPLAEEVTLHTMVSNTEHFAVVPDQITLEPYEQATFELQFRPSSLTEVEETTVTLTHPQFGELVYIATGQGLLPGVLPTVQMFSPLGEMGSHTIMFRNPFPFPLPADIFLTGMRSVAPGARVGLEEDASSAASKAFGLLLRKAQGIVIPAKGVQQIGVSFAPERLGEYSAAVQLRSTVGGRNLLWCYPLSGMAESASAARVARLVTPCKSSVLKDVDIPLKVRWPAWKCPIHPCIGSSRHTNPSHPPPGPPPRRPRTARRRAGAGRFFLRAHHRPQVPAAAVARVAHIAQGGRRNRPVGAGRGHVDRGFAGLRAQVPRAVRAVEGLFHHRGDGHFVPRPRAVEGVSRLGCDGADTRRHHPPHVRCGQQGPSDDPPQQPIPGLFIVPSLLHGQVFAAFLRHAVVRRARTVWRRRHAVRHHVRAAGVRIPRARDTHCGHR